LYKSINLFFYLLTNIQCKVHDDILVAMTYVRQMFSSSSGVRPVCWMILIYKLLVQVQWNYTTL